MFLEYIYEFLINTALPASNRCISRMLWAKKLKMINLTYDFNTCLGAIGIASHADVLRGSSGVPVPLGQYVRQRGEFHISHDVSQLISVFSPRRKERSRVFNDLSFKMQLIQGKFQC